MWKKSLVFIMIICLIAGFVQEGVIYSRATGEESVQEEMIVSTETEEQTDETIEKELNNEEQENENKQEETQQEQEEQQEEKKEETEPAKEKNEQAEVPQVQETVPAENVQEEEPKAEFLPEMQMTALENMVKASPEASSNETVPVIIDRNGVQTEGTIPVGRIADNAPKDMEGSHFVGAYAVTETGETPIILVQSYTNEETGEVHIYYTLTEDATTGVELKLDQGQYIKLVYKTSCNITYGVTLEDGTVCNEGGVFQDQLETVDYGSDLRIHFVVGAGSTAGAYTFMSMKAVGADGTETPIAPDEDGYAYLKDVRQNYTIIAQVKKVEAYKLVVDKQTGGHVCWAGHGDETGSNTSNPYSVTPSKFCSYRESDGATVTAAPGGTIYFVLYSQAWTGGGIWELKSLSINDKPVDPIYDGGEYTTDLGDGMIAHFQYLGPGNDKHLTGSGSLFTDAPKDKIRCKYACWVENVSKDIHVKFESFDSTNHEIVKLAEANGIQEICASTFDRQAVGGDYLNLGKNNITRLLPKVGHYDFWKDLLTPVSKVGDTVSDVVYDGINSDAPYAASFWGDWENSWFYSQYAHVEVQSNVFKDIAAADANKQTLEWGSRYIYFKTKPGYDPETLEAQMTGKTAGSTSGRVKVNELGNIYELSSEAIKTVVYSANNNRSMYLARNKGYMWYIRYQGCGINSRNLYLNCSPYQFGVEYDLNGGTIDGSETYTDSKKYTIESGKNKISLPNKNPMKDGYVFAGWKLEAIKPTNVETVDTTEYDPLKGVKTNYDTNDVFTINSDNYEAALETERQKYDMTVDENSKYGSYVTYHCIDYIPKSDGNHRFRFVAQWTEADDPNAPKAEYKVKIYTEAAQGTEGAVEVDGRFYTLSEKSYLGVKGENIIGVVQPPEGYIQDAKSVTRLEHFMQDGNTADELIYYFRLPEWEVSQTTDPEGGASEDVAGKVKLDEEIQYTITVQNKENKKMVLPEGTVLTEVLPEGMGVPVNGENDAFQYSYDASTRTITYTALSSIEIAAGEKIELYYSATVEKGALMENQAKMAVTWKEYDSNKLYLVTVADLKITNLLKGDYADYSKTFKVKVVLTDSKGNPLNPNIVEYKGGKLNVSGANSAPADGKAAINSKNELFLNLKHGQTVTLKELPYGSVYMVQQEDEDGYITTYSGYTGGLLPGTEIPIVTGVWPSPEDFEDEYEIKTLQPGGVFQYDDGNYYVICREFSLNQEQAESGPGEAGPDGQTNGWLGVTKLTGKIHEMEDDAESINGLTRGDIVKYKNNYYVFNTGGEWGCNPENDTATPSQYYKLRGFQEDLLGDKTVDITNTYEKVSPTGIKGSDHYPMGFVAALSFLAIFAAGYGVKRKNDKKISK